MTSTTGRTIDVSMPQVMRTVTLRVRFARLADFRLRAGTWVMRLAGCVAGCQVEIVGD